VNVTVDGLQARTGTDAEGVFVLTSLPPGPRVLRFARYNYRPHSLSIDVSTVDRPEEMQPAIVALEPMSDAERAAVVAAVRGEALLADGARTYGVTLSGLLRFADGLPAPYVPVRVGDRRTVTDAQGIYVFTNLPDGEQTVYAEFPGVGEVPVP